MEKYRKRVGKAAWHQSADGEKRNERDGRETGDTAGRQRERPSRAPS